MNKRKYIIYLLFAAVALLGGCNESLEDTYSDYSGTIGCQLGEWRGCHD